MFVAIAGMFLGTTVMFVVTTVLFLGATLVFTGGTAMFSGGTVMFTRATAMSVAATVVFVVGTIHEAKVWSKQTLETQNVTAVIGRNFSSVFSEDDFSLERLGQVVLSVRKVHAGGRHSLRQS